MALARFLHRGVSEHCMGMPHVVPHGVSYFGHFQADSVETNDMSWYPNV